MTPGGAASSRKGTRYEQELVNRFKAGGWGALRLGASGGGGDADLPDVLAGRPISFPYRHNNRMVVDNRSDAESDRFAAELFAVELKCGDATTLYVGREEVIALERFAQQWGATPYLGARSTQRGTPTDTYLVRPEDARRTDSGVYGLPIADVADRAAVVVGSGGVEVRDVR